jgi:tRNA threonylcarbamoyladenosine biosynthesis protein TsaB
MPAPLLALETSTATARVAVVAGDRTLAMLEKTAARHSANLLGLIDEALAAAGVRLPDLQAIACGRGPGSFTGLRVGLAAAKGLALPTGIPLVLASSLEALAHDLAELGGGAEALLCPCLDAGKGQVYGRVYRGVPPAAVTDDEWVIDPEDLARRVAALGGPVRIGGNGVDRHLELFRARFGDGAVQAVPGPSAVAVAHLAQGRLARGETDDLATAVPSYGRPPDITRPKQS